MRYYENPYVVITNRIIHLTHTERDLLTLMHYITKQGYFPYRSTVTEEDIRTEMMWTKKYTKEMLKKLQRKKLIYKSDILRRENFDGSQSPLWLLNQGPRRMRKKYNKAATDAGNKAMKIAGTTPYWGNAAYEAAIAKTWEIVKKRDEK